MLKYKNVFIMVDRCILKNTRVFECFSMHLGVFVLYFIVLVVYFNVFE
jgi:amino acid permease